MKSNVILDNSIREYKLSIEKTDQGYLIGVLINRNNLLYNHSEKIPFEKREVIDLLHNVLKMKYSIDFRYQNLESEDPIFRTIAKFHYDKDSWNCPVEYLYTIKKLTENKLIIEDYKDPEDLFLFEQPIKKSLWDRILSKIL